MCYYILIFQICTRFKKDINNNFDAFSISQIWWYRSSALHQGLLVTLGPQWYLHPSH